MVIPMRALETQGKGKNRSDCMKQFKAAWGRFAADEANVPEREAQATLTRTVSAVAAAAGAGIMVEDDVRILGSTQVSCTSH